MSKTKIPIFTALVLAIPTVAYTAKLNDTNITQCANQDQSGLPCPIDDFPRQDADYKTPFNYTKLTTTGQEAPANATDHACVRDNTTGLIWEVKTIDGLHGKDNTYTWDETEEFVQDVNTEKLCGFDDWRLPNPQELVSIVDYSGITPGIDAEYFPNTKGTNYWTGTLDLFKDPYYDTDDVVRYMVVDFGSGNFSSISKPGIVTAVLKDIALAVRLVRGNRLEPQFNKDNNNQTITDQSTGLMWSKCPDYLTYCNTQYFNYKTWQQALQLAKNSHLAGHNDWRLPNVKELLSLVDYSKSFPSINSDIFPEMIPLPVWTASPIGDSSSSWIINFDFGRVMPKIRSYRNLVMLVRDVVTTPTITKPIADTDTPSVVTATSARLKGTVNPKGADTTVIFKFNDSETITADPSSIAANASKTDVKADKDGLTCGTNYSYRVEATNIKGTTLGGNKQFTTSNCSGPVNPPTVITNNVSKATLTGTVTPNNSSISKIFFEYGNSDAYGNVIDDISTASINVNATIAVECGKTYYYRLGVTSNETNYYGEKKVFSINCSDTPNTSTPVATTGNASNVDKTTATLNGTVDGKDKTVNVSFDYGTSANYGNNKVATPSSFTGVKAVTSNLTGLTCGTTYHYRLKAEYDGGSALGTDKTFTTANCSGDNTVSKPDLIITKMAIFVDNSETTSIKSGKTATVKVTIKNQGDANTTSNKFMLKLWFNKPDNTTVNALCNNSGHDRKKADLVLTAGETKDMEFVYTPKSPGTKTLFSFVDGICGVSESDETNNQFTLPYTVTSSN